MAVLATLVRRLALALLVFVGLTLLVFAMGRLIPGDPVQRMAGERRLDPTYYAETLHRLGLDLPLHEQYGRFLWRTLHLDLGESFATHEPVISEFASLFPATVELSLAALLWAAALGVPAGVWAAVRRGGWFDRLVAGISLVAYSMPVFWWGLLLIMLFAVELRDLAPALALPVAGRMGLEFDVPVRTGFMLVDAALSGEPGAWRSAAVHLVLPAIVLGTGALAVFARMARSATLEVLHEDFVRTAHAKGLTLRRVVWVHAFSNALLPLLTVAGMMVGSLLGGAVFTETIFSWPGVGKWLVESISRRDYPVLQGGLLITAALMIAVNLFVDLLYAVADPRLRR
jgi:dipeptide transport system permease protein